MLGDVFGYLTDGANWSGSNGIGAFAVQQLLLTVTALLVAMVLGLPLALYLGHRRRGGFLAVNVVQRRPGGPGLRGAAGPVAGPGRAPTSSAPTAAPAWRR